MLLGQEGNDTLRGGLGSDSLIGGEGDDTLIEEAIGAQAQVVSLESNTFQGGKGNDRLEGWTAADTYIFNRGDGQDVINDYDFGSYVSYDRYGYSNGTRNGSFNKTDKIVFGEGISAREVSYKKVANDLLISLNNSEDQITIENWYESSKNRIEEIHFSDAIVQTSTEIHELGIRGQFSEGNDIVKRQ